MNRSYLPDRGSLEGGIVRLYAKFTLGASGAVASTTWSKGITSITRLSAGSYKITLQDSYNALLFANTNVIVAAAVNPANVGVVSRIEAHDVVDSTTPYVTVSFYATDDGAEVDGTSGDVVLVELVLKGTSADY